MQHADIKPLPAESAMLPVKKGSRRRSRPWYRKPARVIPVVLLGALFVLAVAIWVYLGQSFNEINALSSLPGTVAVEADEGDGQVVLDTGPAQQAVMEADAKQPEEQRPATANAVADAERPAVEGPLSTPTTAKEQPASDGSVNILLMGVDARSGEAIDVGVRPDSLSVMNLNPDTGSCRILGIPRDTRTDLPGYGLTKINHALAVGGVPYQQLVVENLLGIQIDHYALVDFAGVVGVVDAVGGITVENPQAFEHQGIQFAAGTIRLDGEMALTYSRYRYDAGGDFARIDRQQQVIRAILAEVSPSSAVRLLPQLMGDLSGHFKTDYSLGDLVGIVNDYGDTCTAETLETHALDGTVATYPDPLFEVDLSYVEVAQADIDAGVAWLVTGEPAAAMRTREGHWQPLGAR